MVQSLSHVQFFAIPWVCMTGPLFSTISWCLLKFISIELVMPSNHLILCRPLLLLPSIFPSIRVFSNELALHIRWPKYWSFSIGPSNEYSGLIFFRIDLFNLLAGPGALKSLLQHHSLKASVLQHSAFFMIWLWHPYMTTGKNIALTIRTFFGKAMSLLFNMLSRFVIDFLPKSQCLLISWLWSLSAMILEPKKIKSVTSVWILIKVKVSIAQSCLTLWDSVDCSLLGSSVHGILQVRILEWVAIPFSRGSSQSGDWTLVSITGRFFTTWLSREENRICHCS